jgi:hypothetical protein
MMMPSAPFLLARRSRSWVRLVAFLERNFGRTAQHAPADLCVLNVRNPIAWRPRHSDGSNLLTWTMFLDAPIDVETAHKLQAIGRVLMANRHTGERVELVVRPAG